MVFKTIEVKQVNELYEISFSYDTNLISLVKNVPGRAWVPERKVWTIPRAHLGMFFNQIKGTPYEEWLNVDSEEHLFQNETLDKTEQIPDIDISNIDYKVAEDYKPYNHQLDFMKYAIDRQNHNLMSGFLLCDQQGLAKTNEFCNLALYNKNNYNFKHCLIICCMNTSKYAWVNDIKIHLDMDAYILGTRKLKKKGTLKYDTGSEAKLQDLQTMKLYGEEGGEDLPYFLVVNIEAMRSKIGNSYAISEQITKLIKDGQINMIAIDEIHRNCSPQSIQGKRILDIKKKTGNNCMWIPITGTPIVNKATDVYLPLKLVDGHAYKNYWTWCQEFCIYGGYGGHEIIGYRNMPKLKEMLQKNMLRRLKSDVLDLPPKIFYTEYVENTPYQTKLYNKVCDDILSERESIVRSLNPLAKMMKLRQVNGSPELVDDKLFYTDKDYIKHNSKLQRLLELLEEIHEREEKVVLFSNWVEPLRMIYTYISEKYKATTYVGSLKENIRQKHIEQFKNDPKTTILMGTIDALGVTHTLTVANNIIFYDEPWTVASFDQCCDRCHRISTTKPVNIYKLLAKDTIDERVDDLLYNKRRMSTFIVDNIDIHSHPELFDILMGVK